MTLRIRGALAVSSGLLLWLSFPNPWALDFQAWTGWVAWVALVPLCAAIAELDPAKAFRVGFLSGAIFFVLSLSWLTHVKPMGLAALPAWLALAAWCALFVGAWAAGVAWMEGRRIPHPALAAAAVWTLLELLRERLFSGFPWVNLGSSQALNGEILPLAAVTGPLGLNFAVALGNFCVYALLVRPAWTLGWKRSVSATAVVLLLGLGVLIGKNRAPVDGASVAVGVIQGGIDMDQAWTRDYRDQLMDTYLGLSRQAIENGARVILWPESAFPGFFNEDAEEARRLKGFAKENGVDLMIGAIFEEGRGFSNSALWIDPSGNTRTQGKRHLVPFGEYVPFRRAIPVLDSAMARLGVSEIIPGQAGPLFNLGGLKTRPLVCYETVFPAMVREGDAPDMLAVITVDTWYGRSAGPVWHALQCVFRAVENGAWVARSAATGISLFVDPQGGIHQPIALDKAGFAVMKIGQGRATIYRRFGDWFFWPILFLLVGLIWRAHSHKMRN